MIAHVGLPNEDIKGYQKKSSKMVKIAKKKGNDIWYAILK